MKRQFGIFTVFFLVVFLVGTAFAADPNVQELQKQLDKLMKQVQDMDATMKAQKSQVDALQNKIKELQKEAPKAAEAAPAEVKVTSKYKINIYGQLKFDADYDTNNMGTDEFIKFIPKTATGEDKTTFNVRDTRLGVAIEGPAVNGWTPRGRFESDFYGNAGDSSRNGALRIRLAYVDFVKGDTLIRIGQDWNKIASLNPTNIDFAIMGYNGNLWERAPQLTVEQKFGGSLQALLTVYRYRWADDDADVNTQIHMPWVGGRVAYSGKLLDPEKNAWLAFGAAFRHGEAVNNDVTPYLADLELQIPISIFELRGEGYMGQGLGIDYFHQGGGFNTLGDAILTRGGFIQLSAKPIKDIQLTAGYGMDDPRNKDVAHSSFYEKSQYTFGNLLVTVMKDITAGAQIAHVQTTFPTVTKHGTRYMTSLIYNW